MKLKDILILGLLSGGAFWLGMRGIGGEVRSEAKPSVSGAGKAAARPTVGRSVGAPEGQELARESMSREQSAPVAGEEPRFIRELPDLPRDSTGQAVDTFQYELADFLMGGEDSYAELPGLWRDAPDLHQPLVRAVGEAQHRRGLAFLASVLGQDPAVNAVVLSEIGRLAPLADPDLARDVADPLRWLVKSSDDVTAVQAAVHALSRLRDEESIPLLIGLLDDDSAGVRTHAVRALEEITVLSYGEDYERWVSWYDAEEAWYEEHVDELLAKLESDEEEQVFDAVRGLAKLRLHRDEIASEMVLLLRHESPALRRLACQGLSQVGSQVAIQPLVDCLADGDESVAQSAWIALRWLTSLDLPAEHQTWVAAIESRS